ncbi:LOW QUALITY PROTEIN: polyprotein [Phytophthora megakarya]|uniref:Polyprotein n=1 Tax=Phytophthora megakarya TaxID=4795 RepID=A0A225X537_9STRA|nr:LOW QUALITY PROTEIN: polyprotein [Phytophthora megakarya]
MTLARKGLLKSLESKITDAWLVNDAKTLPIIAPGVDPQHQTKIRSTVRVMEVWNTLHEYHNRTTLHNRVGMTGWLPEFKMEEVTPMTKHLVAFDELVVGLQMLGEPENEARQIVVLLDNDRTMALTHVRDIAARLNYAEAQQPAAYREASVFLNAKWDNSVENVDIAPLECFHDAYITIISRAKLEHSLEYDLIVSNVDNTKDITLIEFTEKFLKEGTFAEEGKYGEGNRNGGFKGKRFGCDQIGHMKRDCPVKNSGAGSDAVFDVGEERLTG